MAIKKYRKRVPQNPAGLYDLDVVGAKTLRGFNSSQLRALPTYRPSEIKTLRLKTKASQAVFAAYLNTSVSTVRKWEIGDKRPSGTALKLLNIVQRKGLEALR